MHDVRITYTFFFENHQLLFAVLLSHMYFFRRISDSQFTSWIHEFEEEELTEPIGPVPFSAEYLICRYVQTDGWMDGRFNPGWAG